MKVELDLEFISWPIPESVMVAGAINSNDVRRFELSEIPSKVLMEMCTELVDGIFRAAQKQVPYTLSYVPMVDPGDNPGESADERRSAINQGAAEIKDMLVTNDHYALRFRDNIYTNATRVEVMMIFTSGESGDIGQTFISYLGRPYKIWHCINENDVSNSLERAMAKAKDEL